MTWKVEAAREVLEMSQPALVLDLMKSTLKRKILARSFPGERLREKSP
jgi:hypothetical protein